MSIISLASGRRLAFDTYGDPAGRPCFYFHGWPSSRQQGKLMHTLGQELGLCIVAPDRPGIGESEFHDGRRLLDWPPVLAELAAHLGWERFHVFGVSGGGPYALVTAYAMPERVLSTSLVCGAPPLRLLGTRELFWVYRWALVVRQWMPWMLGLVLKIALLFSRCKPTQWPLRWLVAFMGSRDRLALQDEVAYAAIIESFRGAMRSGPRGVQADADVYLQDWAFNLSHITVPVHVWHGGSDENIPMSYARQVTAMLPCAITHFVAEEGHYSLPVMRAREIAMTAMQSE
jgi:pimeloyl-ACP methyl ester carboxylesterase